MVKVEEILENLKGIRENIPSIYQAQFRLIIDALSKPLDNELIIAIQDNLEFISNYENLDSFTRNEIMNIITDLETLFS